MVAAGTVNILPENQLMFNNYIGLASGLPLPPYRAGMVGKREAAYQKLPPPILSKTIMQIVFAILGGLASWS